MPDSARTLAVAVAEGARDHGDRPAMLGVAASLTYAELSARANQYARWGLSLGLSKGDRVALMLDNQADYPAIWIGLSRIGVVTALLNTQLIGEGLAHCLRLSDSRHVIAGAPYIDAIANLELLEHCFIHGADHASFARVDAVAATLPDGVLDPADADVRLRDAALLIYTSGTTGLPKAAHVSHYRIMMWSEWFAGITNATADDRLYDCLPMYHSIGGVVAVGSMLVAGAAVIVRDGFSASRFWPDVVATRATIFQYIGELCRYLLVAAADETPGHRLRLCIGNGLRADIWEAFARRFAIPRVIEFYAATEGSFSLFNLEGRPGAVGRVPRFMAHRSPVALVRFDHGTESPVRDGGGFCQRCGSGEVGEAIGMIASEPSALATRFEGYTSESETRRKILRDVFVPGDMWFRTGDLMRQDSAGYFYFVDRIGDTFRWKGENVATSDVADALGSFPGLVDAAVYGVSVPGADGRAGMAAIVAPAGVDLAALRDHLAARLPRFARPLFLRVRDRMDVTGTFKLKKQDLIREGFDPAVVTDALFVDDPHDMRFRRLDDAYFTRIVSGDVKF